MLMPTFTQLTQSSTSSQVVGLGLHCRP